MLGPYGQCDPVPDRGEWCGILYDWIPRIFSTCSSDLWKRRTVKKYFVEERIRHPLCAFSYIIRWTSLFHPVQPGHSFLCRCQNWQGSHGTNPITWIVKCLRFPCWSWKSYLCGRKRYGKTAVLKRTGKFDMVTTNTLADRFDASPAVVGNQLFLRGHKFLYCIERVVRKKL